MIEKKIPVCFSSGTGRTGSLIAIDICMRSYESKRVVDILSCVSSMRKERAGVVQNKEQYALIYKVLVLLLYLQTVENCCLGRKTWFRSYCVGL